ncbi:MAG: ABC transporter ATP-binding protein [Fastidiosipilaceae bacterium]|jgi:ABC-type dipeptide/oligopeptide/nickel transport system ATPase subunit|nr:ABC transporter ATP-binding protein [Clostridiaceae bacterium]
MSQILIKYDRVSKSFGSPYRSRKIPVFHDLSLTIGTNERIGILGPSGCGKSTLLRMLLGLIPFEGGKIFFRQQDIKKMTKVERKQFHQDVQVVLQDPLNAFNPVWRMQRSLLEPFVLFPSLKNLLQPENLIKTQLNAVGLEPALLNRYPHQLSGGQLQRLALARALLVDPVCLFLDEATSMLDVSIQAQIMQLIKERQKSKNMSVVIISHDRELIKHMCQRIYAFKDEKFGEIKPSEL